MTDREQIEKLVERGTWLDGFNVARLRQADGVIVDYVEIDPRLKPRKKHVWVFFWKNARYTSQEFEKHIDQVNIAAWRFRLSNA